MRGLGKERMGGLRCLSFYCFVASKGSFFKHCTNVCMLSPCSTCIDGDELIALVSALTVTLISFKNQILLSYPVFRFYILRGAEHLFRLRKFTAVII